MADLDIGIRITADAAGIALADRARLALTSLREELAKPPQTAALAAEADALRANLQLELDLINESVRNKLASEEAGNRQRLAILERGAAQARALQESFAAPHLGPLPELPPRFSSPAPVATLPSSASPTLPTVAAATVSAQELATSTNIAIGRFAELGRTIDATNEKAVRGFRAEGDALAVELVRLGATDAEINKIGASIAALERRAGAASVPIVPDPAPVVNGMNKIPPSARTAANALSLLAGSATAGRGSLSGMANAAGGLAFGLSQLSGSAKVVAGAAGIGAAVTVLAVLIELLERGTEETRKQDAAFKAFGETDLSFRARAKAVGDAVSELSRQPGNNAAQVQLVGITKAADEARAALVKTRKELTDTFNRPTFSQGVAGEVTSRAGDMIAIAQDLQALRKQFLANNLTIEEFTRRMHAIEQAHPDFSVEIAQTLSLAANYSAAAESLRKLTAAGLQAQAEEVDTKRRLGLTPELTKSFLDINAQFAALATGGPLALRRVADEQQAVEKATAAWKQFTLTKEGDAFADLTFANARDQKNQRALELLAEARNVVTTERTVGGGVALRDLADRETQKAAQLQIARTQGDAAVRRKTADDEFADAKIQLARMSGLETDRAKASEALERAHAETIRKIDKDEADKLLALETHLTDERLAAEAKLSDDTFGQQRAAAQRQLDADLKSIRDLHLQRAVADAEEANARRAHAATIAAIEHERADKITEITIAAQQRVDALTGRSGDADPAKIRQGYQKQLDVLAATIASADTSDVEKNAARLGQATIERLIPLEVAQARMGELEKTIGAASTRGDTTVTQTSALLQSHAITERQARERIVSALSAERDVLAATIPLLEAEADALPGNTEAQAKLDTYRTKLLELNLTIAQTSDEFFKLKEAGRDATQTAIAGFLESATRLGTQDRTEIRALAGQLQAARDELNGLLSIAADKRTPEENQRITALRAEVEQTTVGLQNAKSAITSWRDLFVEAAQSIIDALIKVSSQMLATQAIESLLGFVGHAVVGAATGSAAATLSGDVPTGVVTAASGGFVQGPGTATSDSISARLSAGEYVVRAAAVEHWGVETMNAINRGDMDRRYRAAPIRGRQSVARFAEGGLVESPGASRFAQAAGGGTTRVVIEHSPDVVVREVQSSDGQRAIVSVIQKNPTAVRAAIGR